MTPSPAVTAITGPQQAIWSAHLGASAGWQVADLGCGTGVSAAAVLERLGPTGRVYGVDASAEMLAFARRRVLDPRVVWVEGRAEEALAGDELPEMLDAAVANSVIWQLPTSVFGILRKRMRRGGVFVFNTGADLLGVHTRRTSRSLAEVVEQVAKDEFGYLRPPRPLEEQYSGPEARPSWPLFWAKPASPSTTSGCTKSGPAPQSLSAIGWPSPSSTSINFGAWPMRPGWRSSTGRTTGGIRTAPVRPDSFTACAPSPPDQADVGRGPGPASRQIGPQLEFAPVCDRTHALLTLWNDPVFCAQFCAAVLVIARCGSSCYSRAK